ESPAEGSPSRTLKVKREDFLRVLDSVSPGLSSREILVLEQFDRFIFKDGEVITFNGDDVSCRAPSPLDGSITGAVLGKPLLDILRRLPDETVGVEAGKGELLIRGKKKQAAVRMGEVFLELAADVEAPGKWHKLPPSFGEAVELVQECASSRGDSNQFGK